MIRKRYLVVTVAVWLAGCATDKSQTLEGLDDTELDIKIETGVPIEGARNKAMDNYWEFVAGAKEQKQKVVAMRRLADLEMERSEERFQKQLDVAEQKEGADAEIDLNTLKEITYRGAIKLYEDALKVASEGEGGLMPEVLYPLSRAYERAGNQEKAAWTLGKLLESAPAAANRDELHFRRGELLFDLREFGQAEQAYSQVMTIGAGSTYYEKALSKRGWSAFKQEQYKRALNSFIDLIDRKLRDAAGVIRDDDSRLSRGDKELISDIFRIVTLSFSELGGAPAIKAYFAKRGKRDYEPRIYRLLGKFYLGKERIRDGADTFQAFARVYPLDAQAFEFDLRAIEAYTAAGFASLLIELKQSFVKRYRVNGRYWKHFEDQEDTILVKLHAALRKHSEDVVQHLHAQAQKTRSQAGYQEAFVWYRQHFKWFGQSENAQWFGQSFNAQKLNFFYAELLFEAGQYEAAAREYEKTAYQYVRFGDNAEAGYAALLAYNKQEELAEGSQKKTWSRLAVGSALRFGKTFPGDKRAAEVLAKAAEDMFALKKYDQAATAARQILEVSRDAQQAETRRTAWKIIARAEFEKGDYARAEVAYKVALSLTDESDPSHSVLEDGLAAAIYKQGEYMKSKGNLQAAIVQFSRVSKASPGSSITVSAEFDIASSMLEVGDWHNAIREFLNFRQTNSDHPLSNRVAENLVKAYLETDQSVKAADELVRLASAKDDPEVKRAALWQAAELYEKAGDEQQVIATYKRYIGMSPSPLEPAIEARSKLAAIYGKAGQADDRQYWLQEIIRHDKNGSDESTPRTHYLAAKAAFELAEPVLQAFQQVKLVRPLKQNLTHKKAKMKEAVNAYTLAADYDIAEVTTASVYWLAEIYNEFSRELIASERPPGLSEEELEQYDLLLEEQAYPFEEKSINIHETNVGRTAQGTYDEWIKKSFGKLRELSPVRYAKAEKSEPVAQLIY